MPPVACFPFPENCHRGPYPNPNLTQNLSPNPPNATNLNPRPITLTITPKPYRKRGADVLGGSFRGGGVSGKCPETVCGYVTVVGRPLWESINVLRACNHLGCQ